MQGSGQARPDSGRWDGRITAFVEERGRMSIATHEKEGSGWLPRLRRGFDSLPSRISVWACGATLFASLVVTGISSETTERFLREKIDQKFPIILRAAAQRIELWYSQRQLEIDTFSRAETVAQGLPRIRDEIRQEAGERTRSELRHYLGYILERFPHYHALFALDDAGIPLIWVGTEVDLPAAARAELATVTDPRIADVRDLDGRRIPVASSSVRGSDGERIASLHALVEPDILEATLDTSELGPSGGIYLFGPSGELLMHSAGSPEREGRARPTPAPDAPLVVEDYTNAAGEHRIGSSLSMERSGWTIAVEEAYDRAFAPVVAVVIEALTINLLVVLAFSLITFQVARSLVRPIVALSDGARRIADGETGVDIPVVERQDEIGVLTRVVNEMTGRLRANQVELQRNRIEIEEANARLVARNEQLQQANEALEQLSITDGLTKLHNHRFFQDHLPREMKRAARTGEPLSLVLIDIDDFKALNDRFGHAVGDSVLRRVSAVMSEQVRDMDLLARYGGEEFALLASQTDLAGAEALAEKVRAAVSTARFPLVDLDGPKDLSITVSIGVACFAGDEKALFNDADAALYRAKANGKDCVVAAGRAERSSTSVA
jgi:diguanylate cyclase (GGDEF)-like protein